MLELVAACLLAASTPTEKESASVAGAEPSPAVGPLGPADARLSLSGVLQVDGRDYLGNDTGLPSTFLIRRARVTLDGTLLQVIAFHVLPDLGEGKAQLLDAYVESGWGPWLLLRAGKEKSPFGLERLIREQDLAFIERGLPINLVPDRDIGVDVHGAWGPWLTYQAGVFNGAVDNGSLDADVDGHKDVVARLFGHPFARSGLTPLAALGLGLALSWGRESGTASSPLLPTFKTGGQQSFFQYVSDSKQGLVAVAAGTHTRVSPQGSWAFGPAALWAEYVWDSQDVARGAQRARVVTQAWQTEASYVFLATRSADAVLPNHPFDARSGTLGAFELVARYGWLDVGDAAFPVFADPRRSASKARAWAVGGSWHLRRGTKLAVNIERTTFEGGAERQDRPPEVALIGRAQVAF